MRRAALYGIYLCPTPGCSCEDCPGLIQVISNIPLSAEFKAYVRGLYPSRFEVLYFSMSTNENMDAMCAGKVHNGYQLLGEYVLK